METEIRIYFQNPFDSLQVVGIQAHQNSTATATLRNKEGNADKSRNPQRVRPHWFSESRSEKESQDNKGPRISTRCRLHRNENISSREENGAV